MYSPDFYRVILTACLTSVQRSLASLDRLHYQLFCMSSLLIHQHREINIHIFVQVNTAESDSGVQRGGICGKFKVSC